MVLYDFHAWHKKVAGSSLHLHTEAWHEWRSYRNCHRNDGYIGVLVTLNIVILLHVKASQFIKIPRIKSFDVFSM